MDTKNCKAFLMDTACRLLKADSPSGFTAQVTTVAEALAEGYEMVSRLIALARAGSIAHAVDIYPRYGSDIGAARSAGRDVRGALIGPGVHASHGMERTHFDGMQATIQLVAAYLECN